MNNDWRLDSSSQRSRKRRPSSPGMLSSIMETKIEPLFAFPDDLSSIKRPRPREKNSVIKKKRLKEFFDNSYAGQRLKRENFRKYLVELITKIPDNDTADKNESKFYNYIRNGVDTIHVSSIDENISKKIFQLVQKKKYDKRAEKYIDILMKEVSQDYVVAIKKSIIDFVLMDPFENTNLSDNEPSKIEAVDFSVRHEFPNRRLKLEKNLFLINPCMRSTLELWVRDWMDFRLVNLDVIKASTESWNLGDFKNKIYQQIQAARKALKTKWFGNIQQLFLLVIIT